MKTSATSGLSCVYPSAGVRGEVVSLSQKRRNTPRNHSKSCLIYMSNLSVYQSICQINVLNTDDVGVEALE